MNCRHSLWRFAALAIFAAALSIGTQVYAQQSPPDQSPSQPSAQQPDQTPAQQPPSAQQPPDQATQSSPGVSGQSANEQTFTGTIVKSGSKYMLQDPSGKTYDLDHQEMLAAHEGKQVRFKGVLDADGKTIHIQ